MAFVDSTTAHVIGVEDGIRAIMADKRISGRELARRLDVSQPWVSLRLTGDTTITVADLEKIAAALGVPVSQLLPVAEPTADGAR